MEIYNLGFTGQRVKELLQDVQNLPSTLASSLASKVSIEDLGLGFTQSVQDSHESGAPSWMKYIGYEGYRKFAYIIRPGTDPTLINTTVSTGSFGLNFGVPNYTDPSFEYDDVKVDPNVNGFGSVAFGAAQIDGDWAFGMGGGNSTVNTSTWPSFAQYSNGSTVATAIYVGPSGKYSAGFGTHITINAPGAFAAGGLNLITTLGMRGMALGDHNIVNSPYSSTIGRYLIANGENQHVRGYLNAVLDSQYVDIVGYGTYNGANSTRKNIMVLDKSGNLRIRGKLFISATNDECTNGVEPQGSQNDLKLTLTSNGTIWTTQNSAVNPNLNTLYKSVIMGDFNIATASQTCSIPSKDYSPGIIINQGNLLIGGTGSGALIVGVNNIAKATGNSANGGPIMLGKGLFGNTEQITLGKFNYLLHGPAATSVDPSNYFPLVVGGGTGYSKASRLNLLTLDGNGSLTVQGNLYCGVHSHTNPTQDGVLACIPFFACRVPKIYTIASKEDRLNPQLGDLYVSKTSAHVEIYVNSTWTTLL